MFGFIFYETKLIVEVENCFDIWNVLEHNWFCLVIVSKLKLEFGVFLLIWGKKSLLECKTSNPNLKLELIQESKEILPKFYVSESSWNI
jgi:hypothetical protein